MGVRIQDSLALTCLLCENRGAYLMTVLSFEVFIVMVFSKRIWKDVHVVGFGGC